MLVQVCSGEREDREEEGTDEHNGGKYCGTHLFS